MPKLNQIVAIEKGSKNRINEEITTVYHATQKAEMMSGLSRVYQPLNDEGERFPPEKKLPQSSSTLILKEHARLMTELFDLTRTKDDANCLAKADIKVDGKVLVTGVPVSHLLFLEKQFVDLRTMVNKIPALDAADRWSWDSNVNAFASEPVQTVKTKKIPKSFEKSPATKEHPAQVELFHEDVVVGTWTLTKYSGGMPAEKKAKLLARVDALLAAAKTAREEANGHDAPEKKEGETIFTFLLEGLTT